MRAQAITEICRVRDYTPHNSLLQQILLLYLALSYYCINIIFNSVQLYTCITKMCEYYLK